MQNPICLASLALLIGLLRCNVLGQTTLYVAVAGDGKVISVDLDKGTVTTVVSGLNEPYGLAVDEHGTFYVSDTDNNAIKKFLPNGTVSTFATGFSYPSGLAIDRWGEVMVADYGSGCYYGLLAGTQTSIACGYDGPVSIRHREINPYPKINPCTPQLVATIRGSGSGRVDLFDEASDGTWTRQQTVTASLSYPYDAASDLSGNLYVSEFGLFRILEFLASSGSTVNTNPVVFATGLSPIGLAFDHAGNLYEADFNGSINKFTLRNGTLNPQPTAIVTGLNQPTYMVFPPSPRVRLRRQGGNAVLTWPDAAFNLQSASTLKSAFTTLPTATSPYTNPLTGSEMFFRLQSK